MPGNNYIVATEKPWNINRYYFEKKTLPGNWHLISDPEQFTFDVVERIMPRYIFFPHWSHKVPNKIVNEYECVCFHETDLPFGRGGSPIQNLIARGFDETVITALKMTDEIDAGPIYLKQKLSLLGLAEEVYIRAAETIFEIIKYIVVNEPKPINQVGDSCYFYRRKPEQSIVGNELDSLKSLFDHIRMLDAETYPHAYLEYGKFCIEFTRPALRSECIEASVKIKLRENNKRSSNE